MTSCCLIFLIAMPTHVQQSYHHPLMYAGRPEGNIVGCCIAKLGISEMLLIFFALFLFFFIYTMYHLSMQ